MPEQNKTYRMLFDGIKVREPHYDLRSVLTEGAELLSKATAWKIGDITANPTYKKNFFSNGESGGFQTRLFQGIVFVMVAGLGLWAWSALKKIK